jgi:hypothetical protein
MAFCQIPQTEGGTCAETAVADPAKRNAGEGHPPGKLAWLVSQGLGVAGARSPCLGWLTGKLGRCAAVPNHARPGRGEFAFFHLYFPFDDCGR